jgi:putative flippase GtrA
LRLLAGEGLRMGLLSLGRLGLGYLLTTGLTELAGMDPKVAYSIALVTCSLFNFFGCRHLVFHGPRAPLWQEAAKFFPSVLLFRTVEVALFSAIFSLKPNYHLAYFATATIAMAGKLLVSKFFIFRRPE